MIASDGEADATSGLIDRAAFTRYLEDALAHLFDHFTLQLHPLGGLLVPDTASELRGRSMSRLLVEAIEALKPDPSVPPASPAWRKYRYMVWRYVEARDPAQISAELGISERQGRRDQHQAIEALSALLWERVASRARSTEGDGRGTGIDDEILRLGAVAPRTTARLGDVLEGALLTTRPLVDRAGRRIETDIPPNLPPVAFNPSIMRQVLIALITCAVDHAEGPTVRLTAADRAGCVAVSLLIHGRAPREEAEPLATTRRLAETQGASVRIATDPPRVRFDLTVPVAERVTVLVIDDNPDVAQLFRRYLGQPYRLVQATTAEEALHLARQERPALITLDVMIPGVDGWQILEQLRRTPETAAIPVIVCSILQEPTLATALGAVGYLAKPLNPRLLRAALDRHLPAP